MHNLTELNTYSDTSVNYVDQGTGSQVLANRYQINGVLDTSKSVFENIEKICSTAGSWLSYDIQDGLWGVVINKSTSSSASFDDSNILGSISVSGTGITDLYNAVNVQFPHRNLRDSSDFVNIEIPDIDRNPNEPDNTLNIVYDILNEPIQAQLLGFIEIKQSRVDLIIKFDTDYSYYGLSAGDVITVTNSQFGFSSKLFRIISVAEIQDEQGPLRIGITALEYDANVYNEDDLYRYTVSDSTGIVGIGSIGIPGTPNVTKIEIDARPRVTISATSPTGIVEGIEFWLTTDVSVPIDANRSYTLISTRYPTGNLPTFSSGTTVTFDYDNLGQTDFLIKCRGFNTTTVGPYSSPSGLVNFVPTQVTNAINANTLAVNSTGGLLTALSVLNLVQKVDTLFGNTANALGANTIFSQVFDLFNDKTGYDIVGQAEGGNLVVPAQITIQNEGTTLTTQVGKINFVGNGIQATGSGPNVTVTIPAAGYLADLGDVTITSPTNNQLLTYDTVTDKWINESYSSAGIPTVNDGLVVPAPATPPANTVVITGINMNSSGANRYGGVQQIADFVGMNASVSFGAIPDLRTVVNRDPVSGDLYVTPTTGSLWLNIPARIGWDKTSLKVSGSDSIETNVEYWAADIRPIIGNISKGNGSVHLYKADGTLVQSLNSSQYNVNVNLIELPFANRAPNTDYYIKFDQNSVKYCNTSGVAVMSVSDIRASYGTSEGSNYAGNTPPYVSNVVPLINAVWPFSTGNADLSPYDAPSPATLPVYNPPGYPPTGGGNVNVVTIDPSYMSLQSAGSKTVTITLDCPPATKTGNMVVSEYNPATGNVANIATFNLANATISGNIVTLGNVTLTANRRYNISNLQNNFTSTAKTVSYTDPMCSNLSLSVNYTASGPKQGVSWTFNTFTDFLNDYALQGTSLSNIRLRSSINLYFSYADIYTGSGYVKIYKASDDSLVQAINVENFYNFPDYLGTYYNKLPLPDTSTNSYLNIYSSSSFQWSIPTTPYTSNATRGMAYRINPTAAFEPNTSYYMLIDSGAFESYYTGITWSGVSDKTLITWTTTTN